MDRGQAYALEAITAGVLLVGALLFALQATGVTPLSASTSSQHIENQQQVTAEGALAAAVEEDAIRVAVLNWNATNQSFYNTSERYHVHGGPPNEFGEILNRTFDSRGIVFNVYVIYQRSGEDRTRQRMVYRGEPSDNAVAASTVVTLYDDDVLYDHDERIVTIDRETHQYDGSDVYQVNEPPIAPDSVHDVHDADGDTYQEGVDYRIIDNDGDGKRDSIDWGINTNHPDTDEAFNISYSPTLDDDRFYASDVYDSGVYNVVTVEVIAWRQ